MKTEYPTIKKPATPDYVLKVLIDQHRQSCEFGEADPDIILDFDTTVHEWQQACVLLSCKQLGRDLNEGWKINCSDAEWKSVLVPAKERKLRGVCELIAAQAVREEVRPLNLLGPPCVSGGTFLTIRSFLSEARANAESIRPSSSLEPFTRRFFHVFLGPISKLAGEITSCKNRNHLALCCTFYFFYLRHCYRDRRWIWWDVLLILGAFLCFILCPILWIAAWIVDRWKGRPKVEFGSLKTFKDLANAIADENTTHYTS